MDNNIICGPDLTVPIPECSLGEFLMQRMKSQRKNDIILVDAETGACQTVGKLLKTSMGIAEGLIKSGLQVNDVVAFVSKNRTELYAATLGVIWSGGVVAPLYSAMTVYELKHMLGLILPKYVFADDEALENVEKALNLLRIDAEIILFDARKDCGCLTFEKLVTEVNAETYKPQPIKSPSTQLCLILSSSGTTGLPKAVGLTHRNLVFHLSTFVPLPGEIWIQSSHFFWVSGILLFLPSITTGTKLIFVKNITEENILKAIHTHRPTWGYFTPYALTSLMNRPDFKKYDVSSFKLIMTGGEVVGQQLLDRMKREWTMVELVYGLTEIVGFVALGAPGSSLLSLKKLRAGTKLKIVDINNKKCLGSNQIGELYVKSIGIMKCYVANPEATKEALDDDGWFHTGDLCYFDDDGHLHIVDRIKELIRFKNCQIIPGEVENVIETLPGVLEAGVIGIPSGEDINLMALVVKLKGFHITEDDVKRVVEENLSDYKCLKGGVRFVDKIPRTVSGKIKRQQLKELA